MKSKFLGSITMISIIIFSPAYGMLVPMTPLEHYTKDDIILVGKVISLEENTTSSQTAYKIKVEKYLKGHQVSDTIDAIGVGAENSTAHKSIETIFQVGNRVLLYLNNFDGNYIISPYSVNAMNFNPDTIIVAPLKLFKAGVAPSDINCKDDLKLVFKVSDGHPACVKPSSMIILVQRGWAR
jgi:hypothetical protein